MRVGILAAVLFSSTIGLMPSAVAQMTPQEHEGQPAPRRRGRDHRNRVLGCRTRRRDPCRGWPDRSRQGLVRDPAAVRAA